VRAGCRCEPASEASERAPQFHSCARTQRRVIADCIVATDPQAARGWCRLPFVARCVGGWSTLSWLAGERAAPPRSIEQKTETSEPPEFQEFSSERTLKRASPWFHARGFVGVGFMTCGDGPWRWYKTTAEVVPAGEGLAVLWYFSFRFPRPPWSRSTTPASRSTSCLVIPAIPFRL
jgi:hypothetical protein